MHRTPLITLSLAALTVLPCAFAGCRHTIAVEPIEVKPIHLTLDINLKVDRELDEFFDYEDQPASTTTSPSDSTNPQNPPAAPMPSGGSLEPGAVEGGAR